MRVVVCLVVVCGCLAQARSGLDASGTGPPDGDGSVVDVVTDGAGLSDAGATCSLLGSTCPNKQGCYPFPFDEVPGSGATRCAFQGVGGPSVPCQSQLECDGLTVCSAPGQPDSICLQRCSLGRPVCAPGSSCAPLAGYPNVGVCLQP